MKCVCFYVCGCEHLMSGGWVGMVACESVLCVVGGIDTNIISICMHLLQMARDGALHGAVDLEGLQPALALRVVLQPREL